MMFEEVIVVEGKDDAKKIRSALGNQTEIIITNGSHLSEQILDEIVLLSKRREIVVFTDPDVQGEKIRKKILEKVPTAKQVFANKQQSIPKDAKHHSLGVEHMSESDIVRTMQNIMTPSKGYASDVLLEDLIFANVLGGAFAKKRREKLGELLHIGYTNGKQFQKRLSMFHINRREFLEALITLNANEK